MDVKPKTLLRRVFEFARSELERRSRPPAPPDSLAGAQELEATVPQAAPRFVSESRSHHDEEPSAPMLDVSQNQHGGWHVHWSLGPEDLVRSQNLISDEAVLCLRVVSFAPARDHVKRDVLDRPFIELSGACELVLGELRGVVAVGLRAGDRFVSIVHHLV